MYREFNGINYRACVYTHILLRDPTMRENVTAVLKCGKQMPKQIEIENSFDIKYKSMVK